MTVSPLQVMNTRYDLPHSTSLAIALCRILKFAFDRNFASRSYPVRQFGCMIVAVVMPALTPSPPCTNAADEAGVDIPGTAPSAIVSDAMLKLFEPREFSAGGPGQSQQTYYYRLFKPVPKPSSKRLPMIVWLHGHGQYELTVHNRGQLAYIQDLVLDDLDRPEKYPFYILAVQCPEDLQWTSSTSAPNDASVQDPANAVIKIVQSLLRELSTLR